MLKAIGMSLGVRKYGVAHMRWGRVVMRGPNKVHEIAIDEIRQDGVYRYLGVAQLILRNRQRTKAPVKK